MEKRLHIKARPLVLITLISSLFLSCGSKRKIEPINVSTDTIMLYTCSLSPELSKAIREGIIEFKQKLQRDPNVVCLTVYKNKDYVNIIISTQAYLYSSKYEMDLYSDSFIAATEIENVTVLVDSVSNHEVFNKLVALSKELLPIEVLNGGDITTCQKEYSFDGIKMRIVSSHCPKGPY